MKESFVIYNSFYEPIKTLKNEQLGKLLRAIFDYTIEGKITQDQDILIAFMFIKNQLDIDADKWKEEKRKRSEAGRLGGINRAKNQNQNLSSKSKQCLAMLSNAKQNQGNQTVNVNVNENVNEYDNVYNNNSCSYINNNMYDFAEKNIGRILTPIEIEKIDIWQNNFNDDIIKYAIQIAVLNNKKTFNYINGILNNWKSRGYKTIQEIKDNEIKSKKEENIEIPDWMEEYNWLEEEL